MFDSVSNGSSSTPNSLLAGGNMSWLAGEDYQHHNISWSSGHGEDIEYRTHNVSTEGSVNSFIYEAVIQGILVCLFTTVGGVMILVFCLIMIQECKVSMAVDSYSTSNSPLDIVPVGGENSQRECSASFLHGGDQATQLLLLWNSQHHPPAGDSQPYLIQE